ncbi:MAG TPA: glycosyltransferase [Solirubrobacteraceae bacterium]
MSLLCGADTAADVAEAIDLLEPDAIVVDCMLAGALAVAERSHVPGAVLVHMLDHGHPEGICARFFSATLPLVNETRHRLGLPALATYAELIEPMALVLVTSVQALERPHSRLTDNVRYIGPVFGGPSQAPVPDLPPEDQPLVLVSFSTTYQHQQEPLQRVADALAQLPVHGLITLGDVLAPELLSLPANVTACAFASHEVLLARASLVVTHAGLGTVMGALSYGVPLLCMPMGRDQDTNAQRVQELGASLTLPLDAGVAEIRQAIVEVLDSGCYRDASSRLGEAFASACGARGAAHELERLCTG